MISLITNYDLNQMSMIGLVRTTEYEVACINSLFFEANILQLNALKAYLYELIGNKTRMQKMISRFPECDEIIEIKAFEGLFPQLKLYYFSYQKFTVEKSKSYADQLIEIVKDIISYSEEYESEKEKEESIFSITHSYISLINDISNFRCAKRTKIWAFNRNEIYRLYKETGEKNIMPKVAPYYINKKGEKITFTSHERAEYQKVSGKIVEENVLKLLETKEYKNMTDTEKTNVIKKTKN